jgi:hypothetical protein
MGKLIKIDANQGVDEVYNDLVEKIW